MSVTMASPPFDGVPPPTYSWRPIGIPGSDVGKSKNKGDKYDPIPKHKVRRKVMIYVDPMETRSDVCFLMYNSTFYYNSNE
jgi:hypothetical protein